MQFFESEDTLLNSPDMTRISYGVTRFKISSGGFGIETAIDFEATDKYSEMPV